MLPPCLGPAARLRVCAIVWRPFGCQQLADGSVACLGDWALSPPRRHGAHVAGLAKAAQSRQINPVSSSAGCSPTFDGTWLRLGCAERRPSALLHRCHGRTPTRPPRVCFLSTGPTARFSSNMSLRNSQRIAYPAKHLNVTCGATKRHKVTPAHAQAGAQLTFLLDWPRGPHIVAQPSVQSCLRRKRHAFAALAAACILCGEACARQSDAAVGALSSGLKLMRHGCAATYTVLLRHGQAHAHSRSTTSPSAHVDARFAKPNNVPTAYLTVARRLHTTTTLHCPLHSPTRTSSPPPLPRPNSLPQPSLESVSFPHFTHPLDLRGPFPAPLRAFSAPPVIHSVQSHFQPTNCIQKTHAALFFPASRTRMHLKM